MDVSQGFCSGGIYRLVGIGGLTLLCLTAISCGGGIVKRGHTIQTGYAGRHARARLAPGRDSTRWDAGIVGGSTSRASYFFAYEQEVDVAGHIHRLIEVPVPGQRYWVYVSAPDELLEVATLEPPSDGVADSRERAASKVALDDDRLDEHGGSLGHDAHDAAWGDEIAPAMYVVPSDKRVSSATPWFVVGGTVYDEDLAHFSINGMVIGRENQAFSQELWLKPGENIVRLTAVDGANNETIVEKHIIYDADALDLSAHEANDDMEAPRVALERPSSGVLYTAQRVLPVTGHAYSDSMRAVHINGVVTSTMSGAFSADVSLAPGRNVLNVLAIDASHHRGRETRVVFYDPEPPELSLFTPVKETVYTMGDHRISGRVSDRYLEDVVLGGSANLDEVSLAVDERGHFSVTVPLESGKNTFLIQARDQAGNRTTRVVEVNNADAYHALVATQEPTGLVAWAQGQMVELSWDPPTLLKDGTPLPAGAKIIYRVFRDQIPVYEGTAVRYRGVTPLARQAYDFHVQAILYGEDGGAHVSRPSASVALEVGLDEPPPAVGAFESRSLVAGSEGGAVPVVDFSETGDGVRTHLAFVVRGRQGDPDRIRYLTSDRYAKKDSWAGSDRALVRADEGWQISELSLAAQGTQVAVVWIEVARTGGLSRLVVLNSEDGGQSFSKERRVMRQGSAWKRDLDSAFDKQGHHHLIWAEANKVYYLNDFEGERDPDGQLRSVFDVEKRWINDQRFTYHHVAEGPCQDGKSDACCTAPYTASYAFAADLNEDERCGADGDCDRESRAYSTRTEQVYVETPSLEVTDDKVTIVARQTRRFDNRRDPNALWGGLEGHSGYPFFGPLVPDPATNTAGVLCAVGSKRYQMGFQQSWLPDQYACAPEIPSDSAERIRADQESGPQTRRTRRGDFYSYSENWGHPLSWYQFKHAGVWHEDDSIVVAQRPLKAGAWSDVRVEPRVVPKLFEADTEARIVFEEVERAVEYGFKRGAWRRSPMASATDSDHPQFEETRTRWRMTTVETFGCEREGDYARCGEPMNPALGPTGPSYPKVASRGDLTYVVYEKGTSSDPNRPGDNPIYLAYSSDGGRHFTNVADPIARGYHPTPAVTANGEWAVVYYEPDVTRLTPSGKALGRIKVARSLDGVNFDQGTVSRAYDGASGLLVDRPANPIHWSTYGSGAAAYVGVPTLRSTGNLLAAAWIEYPENDGDSPRVAVSRAVALDAPEALETQLALSVPDQVVAHQAFAATVECVNTYQVLQSGCDVLSTHLEVGHRSSQALASVVADGQTLSGAQTIHISSKGFGGGGQDSRGAASVGSGSVFEEPSSPRLGSASRVSVALVSPASIVPDPEMGALLQKVEDMAPVAGGRRLPVETPEVLKDNAAGNYRKAVMLRDSLYDGGLGSIREYEEDESNPDSHYLAEYGRTWAYTQGILLAQLTRQGDPRAIDVAVKLCSQMIEASGSSGGGWHFSYNTDGDDWKDMRLVTGASAWALHGLGVYVSSDEFGPGAARTQFSRCYLKGLADLALHRSENKAAPWLMTAGTTTLGLQNAERPSLLPLEEPWASRAVGREWAYYDILDVIGYDSLNTEKGPIIRSFVRGEDGQKQDEQVHTLTEDDEAFFRLLKTSVKAENVVTEHNLDVLSVLNHALSHWPQITRGLSKAVLARSPTQADILEWRDGLRDAIFTHLWREGSLWEKEEEKSEEMGRFVTGGAFDAIGDFKASVYTAVDNCSWLSLSVDYQNLSGAYKAQLAECLNYTVSRFVDDLEFNGNVYHGAFYFPNNFKDPYIDESQEQESLYHLEATTGLVLGLLRFSDSVGDEFPEDSKAFRVKAALLWADMQRFLNDHGLPYSTVPIHNLMTELPSATAAIWYIDVFDYYADHYGHIDQPLKNYTHDVPYDGRIGSQPTNYPLAGMRTFVDDTWAAVTETVEGRRPSRLRVTSYGREADGLPPSGTATLLEGELGAVFRVVEKPDGTIKFPSYDIRIANQANAALKELVGEKISAMSLYYTPVNSTSLRAEVVRTEPFALLGKAVRLSAKGVVDVHTLVGGAEDHYVMLTLVTDHAEWALAASDVGSSGAFALSGGIEVGSDDRRPEGVPALRVYKKTPAFAGPIWPSHRHLVATTSLHSLEPIGEEGNVWQVTAETGQWHFHRHFRGRDGFLPTNAVKLIDMMNPNEVLGEARLDEGRDEGSRVLSGIDPVSEAPFTLLEDQALAIVAAVNRGDFSRAGDWVQGLTNSRAVHHVGGSALWQLPYVVSSSTGAELSAAAPYYETRSQLMALYALGYYVQKAPLNPHEKKSITGLFGHVLNTIEGLYVESSSGRLYAGAGWPSEVQKALSGEPVEHRSLTDMPVFLVSSLEDHVWAYFVYKMARTLFKDEKWNARSRAVRSALVEDFWESRAAEGATAPELERVERPVLLVGPHHAPSASADTIRGAAMYQLFAQRRGLIERAKACADLVTRLANESRDAPPHFTQPFVVLSQRAAADFDPRQEELAWNGFAALAHEASFDDAEEQGLSRAWVGGRTARSLWTLIVQDPRDFLGMASGPMFGVAPVISVDPQTERWLQVAYLDVVAALMVAGDRPYAFDALMTELTTIEFAFRALRESTQGAPEQWAPKHWHATYHGAFEDHLLLAAGRLMNPCRESIPWLIQTNEPVLSVRSIGLTCEAAAAQFERLLVRRTGRNAPGALRFVLEHGDSGFVLARLLRNLGRDSWRLPARDNLLGAFNRPEVILDETDEGDDSALQQLPPFLQFGTVHDESLVALEEEASFDEVAKALFEIWTKHLRHASARRPHHTFEATGIDFVGTMNPADPAHWRRPAIELRYLSGLDSDRVWLTLGGVPVVTDRSLAWALTVSSPEPGGLTRGVMQENVKQLRRFINLTAHGNLPYVAHRAGIFEAELHRMMRTGKIREEDFVSMVFHPKEGPERDAVLAEWTSQFHFSRPESPTWHLHTEGQTHASLELYAQMSERGQTLRAFEVTDAGTVVGPGAPLGGAAVSSLPAQTGESVISVSGEEVEEGSSESRDSDSESGFLEDLRHGAELVLEANLGSSEARAELLSFFEGRLPKLPSERDDEEVVFNNDHRIDWPAPTPVELDVVVGYTSGAGLDALHTVEDALDRTNRIFRESEIPVKLRRVAAEEIGFRTEQLPGFVQKFLREKPSGNRFAVGYRASRADIGIVVGADSVFNIGPRSHVNELSWGRSGGQITLTEDILQERPTFLPTLIARYLGCFDSGLVVSPDLADGFFMYPLGRGYEFETVEGHPLETMGGWPRSGLGAALTMSRERAQVEYFSNPRVPYPGGDMPLGADSGPQAADCAQVIAHAAAAVSHVDGNPLRPVLEVEQIGGISPDNFVGESDGTFHGEVIYKVRNIDYAPVVWKVLNDLNRAVGDQAEDMIWVVADPPLGRLEPGEEAEVVVRIDPKRTRVRRPGTYEGKYFVTTLGRGIPRIPRFKLRMYESGQAPEPEAIGTRSRGSQPESEGDTVEVVSEADSDGVLRLKPFSGQESDAPDACRRIRLRNIGPGEEHWKISGPSDPFFQVQVSVGRPTGPIASGFGTLTLGVQESETLYVCSMGDGDVMGAGKHSAGKLEFWSSGLKSSLMFPVQVVVAVGRVAEGDDAGPPDRVPTQMVDYKRPADDDGEFMAYDQSAWDVLGPQISAVSSPSIYSVQYNEQGAFSVETPGGNDAFAWGSSRLVGEHAVRVLEVDPDGHAVQMGYKIPRADDFETGWGSLFSSGVVVDSVPVNERKVSMALQSGKIQFGRPAVSFVVMVDIEGITDLSQYGVITSMLLGQQEILLRDRVGELSSEGLFGGLAHRTSWWIYQTDLRAAVPVARLVKKVDVPGEDRQAWRIVATTGRLTGESISGYDLFEETPLYIGHKGEWYFHRPFPSDSIPGTRRFELFDPAEPLNTLRAQGFEMGDYIIRLAPESGLF